MIDRWGDESVGATYGNFIALTEKPIEGNENWTSRGESIERITICVWVVYNLTRHMWCFHCLALSIYTRIVHSCCTKKKEKTSCHRAHSCRFVARPQNVLQQAPHIFAITRTRGPSADCVPLLAQSHDMTRGIKNGVSKMSWGWNFITCFVTFIHHFGNVSL